MKLDCTKWVLFMNQRCGTNTVKIITSFQNQIVLILLVEQVVQLL